MNQEHSQADHHGEGDHGGPGHHEHTEQVTIIVNGKEKQWSEKRISYDQLVTLSGEPLPSGPDPGFTITYFDGPREKPEGSVTEGHSVKVVDHMVFNVTPTNRS